MRNKITIRILSPRMIVNITQNVEKVIFKSQLGTIGIFPLHMNMITKIVTGVLSFYSDDVHYRYFIERGVVRVAKPFVDILTTFAVALSEVDIESTFNENNKLKLDIENVEHGSFKHSFLRKKIERNLLLINILGTKND